MKKGLMRICSVAEKSLGCPIEFDHNLFFNQLSEMMSTVYNNDEKNTIIKIKEMVPTYKTEGAK